MLAEQAMNGTSYSNLIPKRHHGECPSNTYGNSGDDYTSPQNCYCEEHCTWEACRLLDSPEDCVRDVGSFWSWDSKKRFWIAQIGGTIFYLTLAFLVYNLHNFYIVFDNCQLK